MLTGFLVLSCEEEPIPDVNYQSEFIGNWSVLEKTGFNAPQSYTVEIRRGGAEDEIFIVGLYNNPFVVVRAKLAGLQLTIPFQTSDSISFTGSGQASLGFDQISIDFVANDGTGDDQINAILVP